MANETFAFKQFVVRQDRCGMKVGTDGVLLGAWAEGGKRILDIGTGTGLIALMMAQRFPNAHIDGIDIDEDACRQASENVAESPFATRITIGNQCLQDFSSEQKYDSIVSNPPYYDSSLTCPDEQRSVARHTERLSFAELAKSVGRLLADEGTFSVVLPVERMDSFLTEALIFSLYETRRCMVKTTAKKTPKRVLMSFSKHPVKTQESTIEILTNPDGTRSAWYYDMTKDFYL